MERSCAENPQTPGAGRQCQVTPGQDALRRMPGTGQRTAWRMPLKMAEGMSNKDMSDMLMAFTIFSLLACCCNPAVWCTSGHHLHTDELLENFCRLSHGIILSGGENQEHLANELYVDGGSYPYQSCLNHLESALSLFIIIHYLRSVSENPAPAISISTLTSIRSNHPGRLPWNGTIGALRKAEQL